MHVTSKNMFAKYTSKYSLVLFVMKNQTLERLNKEAYSVNTVCNIISASFKAEPMPGIPELHCEHKVQFK